MPLIKKPGIKDFGPLGARSRAAKKTTVTTYVTYALFVSRFYYVNRITPNVCLQEAKRREEMGSANVLLREVVAVNTEMVRETPHDHR